MATVVASPTAFPEPELVFDPNPVEPERALTVRFRGRSARPPIVQLVGVGGSAEPVALWRGGGGVELRASGAGEWTLGTVAPGQPGVYPALVEIWEVGTGRRVLERTDWMLMVYPRELLARPAASDPAGAVRAWVAVDLPDSELLYAQERPLLPEDRRVPELHRLFLVSYRQAGREAPSTVFVYVVRDGPLGAWRILGWGTGP
jgi:hypothetical protein